MIAKNLIIAAATLVAASSAFASIKAGTGTDLTNAASWDALPTAGVAATWNAGSNTGIQTVGSAVPWGSIDASASTGALTLQGDGVTTGAITLNLGGTGSVDVIKSGASTLTIANDLNLTAAFTGAVSLGSGSNRIQLNAGAGGMVLNGNITVNGGAGTNDVNLWLRSAATATNNAITGNLTVDGQLAKGDAGTWTLSGTNTIGFVYINNGALLAGSNQAFGTGTIYLSDNALQASPTLASKDGTARSYSNSLDFATAQSPSFTTTQSAIFGQTTGGTGAQTFAGGVNLGTSVRRITTNANTTFAGIVIGTGGGITKLGSAALTLSGFNTYTGLTTITGGTIITAHNSALGTGNVSVGAAGTLQIGDGVTNGVTLGALATLTTATGATLKLGSTASQIIMTGAFTLAADTKIDITGLNLTNGTYTLITGLSGSSTLGAWNSATDLVGGVGGSTYSLALANNNLVLTAVPEPSTYGLLGAGALAGVAFVRRRRRQQAAGI